MPQGHLPYGATMIGYLSFKEARAFVRNLGLKNRSEWNRYCSGELFDKGILPKNIPRWPNESYQNKGWNNWGDWLGTGVIAARLRQYRPFSEAREFAQSLGLKNEKEWRKFSKGQLKEKEILPDDIPADPHQTYKGKGWKSMGDWLGTGYIAPQLRKYRPFTEARDFVRSLGLNYQKEWSEFCKGQLKDKGTLPEDIPAAPQQSYQGRGWKGMGDWLGTGYVAPKFRQYRSFDEARTFVRNLGLTSRTEWQKFCKGQMKEKGILPLDIPANPETKYKGNGWKGVGDWLGTGRIATFHRQYRTFKEARAFVHLLGLISGKEWRQYCKGELKNKETLLQDIPASPEKTYKGKGWKSMGDWLGTDYIAPRLRQYRPFEEARDFVRSLGLKNHEEWSEFCKGELIEKGTLPDDIPANPQQTYKGKGWKSFGDWLGTGTIAPRLRKYRSFEEARNFVRSLGLKNHKEWHKFCKGEIIEKGNLPADIPAKPDNTYKVKGWKGMRDWLAASRS